MTFQKTISAKYQVLSKKWIIQDWTGKNVFPDEKFDNFDDGEEFLSEFLDNKYEEDRGEYYIVEAITAGPVVDIKTGKEKKAQHGFDLGDLNHPSDWDIISKALKLKAEPEHKDNRYIWTGPDIMIVTGNNPVSGEFGDPKRRAPEKGYLSYVGVEGTPEMVAKAVKLLKKYGSFKDESPGRRSFI